MPDVGEGLTEAEVITWNVAPGDTVTVNQVLCEIETAKAAVELPCPYAGVVGELLVAPGETVAVGAPIIAIETAEVAPVEASGAKIGEAGADGRIANLVGYGPRPGSVSRRPRRAAGPGAAAPSDDQLLGTGNRASSGSASATGDHDPGPGAGAADHHSGTGSRASSGSGSRAGDHDQGRGPGPATDRRPGTHDRASSGSGSRAGDHDQGRGPGPATDRRPGTQDRVSSGSGSRAGDHDQGPGPGPATDRRPGTQDRVSSGSASPISDHGSGQGGVHPPGPPTVPLAKPPVRKLARDLGVDLRGISPSGAGGVITRADVEAHLAPPSAPTPVAPRATDGVRREPIRGVRRATAAAVVSSAFTAPHVTEFLAVDVTATMALRDRLRASRAYAEVRLTPLAFVAKAVCLAARRTPEVNARWDEAAGEIVYFDRVQLGIAAATPRGLIVPKVRDADILTLRELADALSTLTATARSGRTPPSDLVGGTFTITNVGVFGVDSGTPILNPGEAAILAVGAIKPTAWVVDGELAVRTVCQLALSFDHRLVDGEQGARFLADVGALLGDPGLALTW